MRTSEQIDAISAAMAKAQGELKPALKDAVNPAYRSKYADLSSVWDACRHVLPKNSLAVWQDVTNDERGIAVTTRIAHSSGQWVEFGPLVVPMMKQDAHGVGSATSYGKRYALAAAVGVVAEEDDDGNAAAGKAPESHNREASTSAKLLASTFKASLRAGVDGKIYEIHDKANRDDKELYLEAWALLTAAERREIKAAIERHNVPNTNRPAREPVEA